MKKIIISVLLVAVICVSAFAINSEDFSLGFSLDADSVKCNTTGSEHGHKTVNAYAVYSLNEKLDLFFSAGTCVIKGGYTNLYDNGKFAAGINCLLFSTEVLENVELRVKSATQFAFHSAKDLTEAYDDCMVASAGLALEADMNIGEAEFTAFARTLVDYTTNYDCRRTNTKNFDNSLSIGLLYNL